MSRQRILLVILFASLAANAFFIGYGATKMIDGAQNKQRGGILRGVGKHLTRNLDDPYREQIIEKLDSLDPTYRQIVQQRHQNYADLRRLLAQPEIDQAAVDTRLAALADLSSELVLVVHKKAVEAIVSVPLSERVKLVDTD